MDMEVLTELFGMFIYVTGALFITAPGIVQLEKYHTPGRLHRALEDLEGNGVEKSHCGFEDLRKYLNSIIDNRDRIAQDVKKIDLHAGSLNMGRGAVLKLRVHDKDGEKRQIEEPLFLNIRVRLDRAIRRGKTKIRTFGIALILLGFTIQMWPELNHFAQLLT
jgi:hypothetical protein